MKSYDATSVRLSSDSRLQRPRVQPTQSSARESTAKLCCITAPDLRWTASLIASLSNPNSRQTALNFEVYCTGSFMRPASDAAVLIFVPVSTRDLFGATASA